jgi:hypothetical protein
MPKKLTILGALTAALVFGVFGLFANSAAGVPIQQFDTSGTYEVDVVICYGGAAPVPDGGDAGRTADCGVGSSSTTVPFDTALLSWSVINQPIGNRLGLPITYTPSDGTTEWQTVSPACTGPDANNECTAQVTVGDLSSRTDVLCTNIPDDVLGDPGGITGTPETDWPDMSGVKWPLPIFKRSSASVANGGFGVPTALSPNFYVLNGVPWPKAGAPVNGFPFNSIDTASLTQLYLSGIAPFPLPAPVPLQLASATSSYPSQAGLSVSAALLGGSPSGPPSDGFTCLDSPQDSAATTTYLKTPAANRVIPRWTVITSAADIVDGTQQSLLDWACITVGTGEPDADGDCDPDGTDTNDAVKDIDGDLVPDGVELALGSSPILADTDGDGSNDFREMILFTDPTDTDSDDDLQLDKLDTNPTNGAATDTTEVFDATDLTDDNCPAVANGAADGNPDRGGVQASQINTDSLRQYHGMGVNSGERTNPNEDLFGDACDTDDDNDGMPDVTEQIFTIVAWSGSTDPGGADLPDSTTCAAPAVGVAPIDQQKADGTGPTGKTWPLDGPWNGDMDLDMVLDGRECEFRSRPDLALRAIASCINGPVDPDGCAQPNNGGSGGANDPDGDLLFLAFSPLAHGSVEATYRTTGINTAAGVTDNDIDNDTCAFVGTADKDSDQDVIGLSLGVGCTTPAPAVGIQDGIEVMFYGTGPGNRDTDRDGCLDGEEIIDIDGSFTTSSASDGFKHIQAAAAFGATLDIGSDGDIDNYEMKPSVGVPAFTEARGGVNYDINKNKSLDVGDRLLIVVAQASGTACSIGEGAITIGALAKNLP